MWSAAQLHAFTLPLPLPTSNQSLVFVVFFAITPAPNRPRLHASGVIGCAASAVPPKKIAGHPERTPALFLSRRSSAGA
jgi:hypothetical protein